MLATEQRFSTRTNSKKVIYNRANTNIRKNSFSIRITKYWNKVPENIVKAPSIEKLHILLMVTYDGFPVQDPKAPLHQTIVFPLFLCTSRDFLIYQLHSLRSTFLRLCLFTFCKYLTMKYI
jgi:hypothetical protein